jgi:transcriptional regulator with XRE-family HTH domain
MIIGERLRALREAKQLSQAHIEERTGLLRCYTSRVEHGYTVPSIETLEKYARALKVPIYMLFCDGEEPPKLRKFKANGKDDSFGRSAKETSYLSRFRLALGNMSNKDRKLLLHIAARMAKRASIGG